MAKTKRGKDIVAAAFFTHALMILTATVTAEVPVDKGADLPVVARLAEPSRDKRLRRGRFLVLDSRIIERRVNARLRLGKVKKHPSNPLFREDKPWEPRYDNVYCNVIYDEQDKLYKCWYSPFIIDERTTSSPLEERNPESRDYMRVRPNGREMGVCYAVSKDGIHWEKPELGLVEFNGNKKNNILMRGYHFKGVFTGPHGAGVFKDLHESDLAKRYKMFFKGSKMAVAFSPDGLHWNLPIECPKIDAHGDTHNNAFWAPDLGKYIGITRLKYGRPSIRQVAWTESPDFINWTKAKVVLEGVKPRLQTHDMVVFPTGGVYIGLLGMMDFPNAKSNFHTKQHVELAWSPDSKEWHRIQPGTPFIGHSPAKAEVYGKMPYDWGTIFASAPIFLEDEVRIYYGACDWYFFDWRKGYLALGTLRPDGWAGYEQIDGNKPAFITTTPIICTGNKLQLCADVQKSGYVKVMLFDKDNKELAESKLIKRTVTDAQVKWQKGFSLEKLKGKEFRLKFQLQGAKLYSFGFDLISQANIPSAQSRSVVDSKEDVERIVSRIIEKQQNAQEAQKQKALTEQRRRTQSPEEQVPGYLAELRNVNPDVRSNASDQLAKIALRVKYIAALEPAVTPLVTALSDKDMDVRDESTEALGNIGSRIKDKALRKFVIDALVRMLSDEDAEVREESAEALGRITSSIEDKAALKPAIQPLVKALSDEDAGVREYAADALANITSRVEDKAAQKPAIQPSIEVLSGGNDDLKRDRYLLLDSRIIDKTTGVKLTLGKVQKHPANPLFGQDHPWEHHYDNFYGNIIYDEELKQFRLWYLNFINGVNSLLYAYSDNGLNWVKPNLGKVEYDGNTNNNIVVMGRHGVSVFKDLRETDPAKRFKMFTKHEAPKWYDQHLEVAFSADGINWSDFIPQKQISATADTDNNAFWAPTLNKYVAMTRQWSRCPYNDQTKAPRHGSPEIDPAIDNRKGYRQVARTESTDFLNWTRAEVVLEGLNTRFQTHCLPVFYYAGVYLGMPGIWETMGERRVYTELAWSPDTVNWHRICPGTSFIPNSDVKGDYDYGMVWRCVSPLFLDCDEVWIYYGGFDLKHGADGRKGYLCLATIKKDRWAGYAAGSAAGTIKTRLVKCAGKALNICADVKDGGSIRAEVVGVSGLSLSDSIPVTADVTDGVVTWPDKDLSALIGTQIKLRFELKNAILYSFSFSDTPISTPKPPPTYTPSRQRDRYLLLDDGIIDSTSNASLELGTPIKHPANPLFGEDKPWEKRFDNLYPNVLYDPQDKIYKCWWSPFIVDNSARGMTLEQRKSKPYREGRGREMAICYATSRDGIEWEKPELGLVEFEGSKQNNIVWRKPHGAGVFKDLHDPDPARRYKTLFKRKKISVGFSADGIHWGPQIMCREIDPKPADGTHYNALWVPELGEYVAFIRLRGAGGRKTPVEKNGRSRSVRQVGRTTSKDFLNWTRAKLVFEGSDVNLQVYSMPVFRYAGLYLGLPVMYNYTADRAFTGLAWSPDTINWHFIAEGTPLIANSEKKGDYDWGCAYSSAYPIFLDKEIRLYYGASDGLHFGWRDGFFCLATLRPDGFAGYEQIAGGSNRAATITTKPVLAVAGSLRLSADVAMSGYVKVTILDKENKELAEGKLIAKTVTDAEVQWLERFSFRSLKGSEIRFRFELRDAKLYSFSFHQ